MTVSLRPEFVNINSIISSGSVGGLNATSSRPVIIGSYSVGTGRLLGIQIVSGWYMGPLTPFNIKYSGPNWYAQPVNPLVPGCFYISAAMNYNINGINRSLFTSETLYNVPTNPITLPNIETTVVITTVGRTNDKPPKFGPEKIRQLGQVATISWRTINATGLTLAISGTPGIQPQRLINSTTIRAWNQFGVSYRPGTIYNYNLTFTAIGSAGTSTRTISLALRYDGQEPK